MRDEGWTWGDLCGELISMGIDPDEVTGNEVNAVINAHSAERAARHIEQAKEASDEPK